MTSPGPSRSCAANKPVTLLVDIDSGLEPTYLTDSKSIEEAVDQVQKLPSHPESTAGWWCTYTDQMTQLVPFHAESLSCSQPLWADFRKSVVRQLSSCIHCVVAYQKASQKWELSSHFRNLDPSIARNLLRSLVRWNIDRLLPSFRCGALDKADSEDENNRRQAACRHAMLEALICPRACMDKRIYNMIFAVFRRSAPIENFNDMLPLVDEYGEFPGGLFFLCFHPKISVSTWALRVLKDCFNDFPLTTVTTRYLIDRAFAIVRKRLTNAATCIAFGFIETPMSALLHGFSVILPLLSVESCTDLLKSADGEAVLTLSRAMENDNFEVAVSAASCLETLLSKLAFEDLFRGDKFSVNALLQSILNTIRRNVEKDSDLSNSSVIKETRAHLRLFFPLFAVIKKGCTKIETTRLFSFTFEALDGLIRDSGRPDDLQDKSSTRGTDDLHHDIFMTCSNVLTWFYNFAAPKQPLDDADRISKFVLLALRTYPEQQWPWKLLRAVLYSDVANFMRSVFQEQVRSFAETIAKDALDVPQRPGIDDIVHRLLAPHNEEEYGVTFVSMLWNDVRNGRHVISSRPINSVLEYETQIFLDLHLVIGASNASRMAAGLDKGKINWKQARGMGTGSQKYIQDCLLLIQDTITKRLSFALSMGCEQSWCKNLPYHATHLLSSDDKSLCDDAMRVLMEMYKLQGITMGGSRGKMLIQRMKANDSHIQMLSSGLLTTARVMYAWGSRLSMRAHARFFLWYCVLVDMKVADCFADVSSQWIFGLLLSFLSSWKLYKCDQTGAPFSEVLVRFFQSLRQVWIALNVSISEALSDQGNSTIKETLTDIALGLLDLHDLLRGGVLCSTWFFTVSKIGPSVRHIPRFSEKIASILKLHSINRKALSLQQCLILAELFEVQGVVEFLNEWQDDDAESSKKLSDVVTSLSARKSGLGAGNKPQRNTKIEDHFKPSSSIPVVPDIAGENKCVTNTLVRNLQRDGPSRPSSSFQSTNSAGEIRALARTPGAPTLTSVRGVQIPIIATRKTAAQNPMSKIAALRNEHRSTALVTRNGVTKKTHVKKEVDEMKCASVPQKTKYDIIREQKKLEAEQRRLAREKDLEAIRQAAVNQSLKPTLHLQEKGRKRELLRLHNSDNPTKHRKVEVASGVTRGAPVRKVVETFALPDHFRFCELRSMDEVYRRLLAVNRTFIANGPQVRNGCFPSVDLYVRHWEPLLVEECRASIQSAMAEESSLSERNGSKHRLEFIVSDSVESIGFFQVVNISRDMKDVVKPLPGSKGEEYSIFKLHKSDLVLLDIPPVVFDSSVSVESVKAVAMVMNIEFSKGQVAIKLNTAFRSVDMAPGKGRIISSCRLMSLITFQRQIDALHDVAKIPDGILWPILSPSEGWKMNRKVTGRLLTGSHPDLIIPERFVASLKVENRLNQSQADAITAVLRSCTPILQSRSASKSNAGDFGGVSLIQGPPGTGKTSTIVALLSSLLLSGSSGTKLRRAGISIEGQRMTVKLPPIRVLVCAPSNAAVDEIMTRVVNDGLIMPGGIRTCPRVVRVGGGTTMQCLQSLDLRRLAKCDEPCPAFEELLDEASISKKKHLGSIHKLNGQIGQLDRARRANQEILTKVMSESNNYEEIQKLEKEIRSQTEGLSSLHHQKNELHKLLSKDRDMSKEAETVRRREQDQNMCKVVNNASIVFATLSSSGHEILQRFSARFDVIIVDEAAQCCEPDILIPIMVGRRSSSASPGFGHMVLVGDPRQLPATILSNNPEVSEPLGCSLFERLADYSPESVHLLKMQYRMHPKISAFPSLQFYDGRLIDAENVLSASMTQPFHDDLRRRFGPLTFLDMSSRSSREVRTGTGSISNPEEARIVVNAIVSMVGTYTNYDFSDNIAILSPYREQVTRIKRILLENKSTRDLKIEVNTIDGIQGREKSIVFLSTVRGENGQAIGFLRDERRMNVAITRAKHSVVIVGHAKILSTHSNAWASLISFCREKECIQQVPPNSTELFPVSHQNVEIKQENPQLKKRPRPKDAEFNKPCISKKGRKRKHGKFQKTDHPTKSDYEPVPSDLNQGSTEGEICINRSVHNPAPIEPEQGQAALRTDQMDATSCKLVPSNRTTVASGCNELSRAETECEMPETNGNGCEVLGEGTSSEVDSRSSKPKLPNDSHVSSVATYANSNRVCVGSKSEFAPKFVGGLGLRSVPMPSVRGADGATMNLQRSEHPKPMSDHLDNARQPNEPATKELPSDQGHPPPHSADTQHKERVRCGWCQKEGRLKFESCAQPGNGDNVLNSCVANGIAEKDGFRGQTVGRENQSPTINTEHGILSRLGQGDEKQGNYRNGMQIDKDVVIDRGESSRVHSDPHERNGYESGSLGLRRQGRTHGGDNIQEHPRSYHETRRGRFGGCSKHNIGRHRQGGLRGNGNDDRASNRNVGRGRHGGNRRRTQGDRRGPTGTNTQHGFSLLETGRQLEKTNETARRAQGP